MNSQRTAFLLLLAELVTAVFVLSSPYPAFEAHAETGVNLPQPYLVKDINRQGSGQPRDLIAQKQGIYFAASYDREATLWKSDGTGQGTSLIKSFGNNSIADPIGSLNGVMANENLYFTTKIPNALWRSNGTEAGTVQVPGPPECEDPLMLTLVGSKVYFFSGAMGGWLCLVGESSNKITYLGYLPTEAIPGKLLLFFRTSFGVGVSNGTEEGTQEFDTAHVAYGNEFKMATINDTLFFTGCTNATGCELWILEGDGNAPQLVLDLEPGPTGSRPSGLVAMNDTVYFSAHTNKLGPFLWKSDGTAGGTKPIAAVNMCCEDDYGFITSAILNNRLYFPGADGNGCEFWETDGTAQGTRLVKDIYTGHNGSISSYPKHLTASSKYVFFTANDGIHGRELWASDGSETGTLLAGNIGTDGDWSYPCEFGSCPNDLVLSNEKLFFSAFDKNHDRELWALDLNEPTPTADFSALPTSGTPPLPVSFKNLPSGEYDSCSWNFGDGTISAGCEDQSHTYTNPGIFDVSLTVSGSDGEDTMIRKDYIIVEYFYRTFMPGVMWK